MRTSWLALGLASGLALGATPSLARTVHHHRHAPVHAAAAYAQGSGADAYGATCYQEPTYMWLQDHNGFNAWPLRPNGWRAGAACNPPGRFH